MNELAVRKVEALNLDDTMRLGDVLSKSGFFADAKGAAQAVAKIMMGRELGLQPIESMVSLHIIQGKPTISAGLMASAVKQSPKYDYKVRRMDDTICEIEFFENGESIGISDFTIEDAKKAGTQNVNKFARNMLFARAMSNGVKWFCPDVFTSAVYLPEEMGAKVDGEGNVIELPQAEISKQPEPAIVPGDTGGFDEWGDVWCQCGVKARHVRGKSGKGWVCGEVPAVCTFKMKDTSPDDPQPEATPEPESEPQPEPAVEEALEAEIEPEPQPEPAPMQGDATEAQKGAVMALAHKVWGRSYPAELEKLQPKPVAELSKSEASALIDKIRAIKVEQEDSAKKQEEPHPLDADATDFNAAPPQENALTKEVRTKREASTAPKEKKQRAIIQALCINATEKGLSFHVSARKSRLDAVNHVLVENGFHVVESFNDIPDKACPIISRKIDSGELFWNAPEETAVAA